MNRMSQPSPAIVVAVLALVAALAGTAFAGTDATTSASVKQQVKKLKKRVEALEQTDQVPGPQGEQGELGLPGEDATKLFAYIRDPGSADAVVEYGSGVTAVNDPTPGTTPYTVTFNRSLVNCTVDAVAGLGDPSEDGFVSAASFPLVDMTNGGPDQATVLFVNDTGTITDTSFMITAFC